jgi:hypothetical protein
VSLPLNSFLALRFIATVEHRFAEGSRAINAAILSELTGNFGPSLMLVWEEDVVLVFASKNTSGCETTEWLHSRMN